MQPFSQSVRESVTIPELGKSEQVRGCFLLKNNKVVLAIDSILAEGEATVFILHPQTENKVRKLPSQSFESQLFIYEDKYLAFTSKAIGKLTFLDLETFEMSSKPKEGLENEITLRTIQNFVPPEQFFQKSISFLYLPVLQDLVVVEEDLNLKKIHFTIYGPTFNKKTVICLDDVQNQKFLLAHVNNQSMLICYSSRSSIGKSSELSVGGHIKWGRQIFSNITKSHIKIAVDVHYQNFLIVSVQGWTIGDQQKILFFVNKVGTLQSNIIMYDIKSSSSKIIKVDSPGFDLIFDCHHVDIQRREMWIQTYSIKYHLPQSTLRLYSVDENLETFNLTDSKSYKAFSEFDLIVQPFTHSFLEFPLSYFNIPRVVPQVPYDEEGFIILEESFPDPINEDDYSEIQANERLLFINQTLNVYGQAYHTMKLTGIMEKYGEATAQQVLKKMVEDNEQWQREHPPQQQTKIEQGQQFIQDEETERDPPLVLKQQQQMEVEEESKY